MGAILQQCGQIENGSGGGQMSMRALIRNFAFLITATLMAAGPAFAADRHVVTSQDSDYFGFDLRTEQNVSLADCENVCLADSSCKAFTYNPKVKWCFLKSDFNQVNSFAGAIGGKVI